MKLFKSMAVAISAATLMAGTAYANEIATENPQENGSIVDRSSVMSTGPVYYTEAQSLNGSPEVWIAEPATVIYSAPVVSSGTHDPSSTARGAGSVATPQQQLYAQDAWVLQPVE